MMGAGDTKQVRLKSVTMQTFFFETLYVLSTQVLRWWRMKKDGQTAAGLQKVQGSQSHFLFRVVHSRLYLSTYPIYF